LKKIFGFLFLFLMMVSVVNAEDVFLSLRNVNTNEIVDEVVVYLDINEQELIRYVEQGKTLEMNLDDGVYDLILGVDDPSTPGKDYFKKETINVLNGLVDDAYLFPVSSIRGIVKDVFDNVVGGAILKFECANELDFSFPLLTDEFGSFSADYIPSGSCKISANYGDAVGFADVDVSHGEMMDVEIILDRTILVIPSSGYGIKGIVAALFIVVVLLLFVKHKKKAVGKLVKKEKMSDISVVSVKPENESNNVSTRAEDIKSTLNKKERDVVEFVSGQNGEVNQASVRHNVGIPRTSLSRVIASLEQKKVIHVKKVGKAVKIKLTDWFLGNE